MNWRFGEEGGARVCKISAFPMGTYLFYAAVFLGVVGVGLAATAAGNKPMIAFGVAFVGWGGVMLLVSFFANDPGTVVEAKEGALFASRVRVFGRAQARFDLACQPTFEVGFHRNPLLFTPGGPDGGHGIWRLKIVARGCEAFTLGDSPSKEELDTAARRLGAYLCAPDGAAAAAPPRGDDIPRPVAFHVAGLALVLVIVGLPCAVWGALQYAASRQCSPTPVEASLADLEAGTAPPDFHVKLGEHVAMYDSTLVSYRGFGEPTAQSRIDWAMVPILSGKHPFLRRLAALAKEHGGLGKIPRNEVPAVETFAVAVLTRKWKTVGDVPSGLKKHASVTGLIINRVAPLTDTEKKLLRERFPKIAPEQVWTLEANRRPYTMAYCFTLMGIGGVCLLGAAGIAVGTRGRGATA